MLRNKATVDSFTEFVEQVEPRLRNALIPTLGPGWRSGSDGRGPRVRLGALGAPSEDGEPGWLLVSGGACCGPAYGKVDGETSAGSV